MLKNMYNLIKKKVGYIYFKKAKCLRLIIYLDVRNRILFKIKLIIINRKKSEKKKNYFAFFLLII